MIATGTEAPGFSLPNQNGESVSTDTYAGQWLVVFFYPNADSPGCTTEACGIRDAWDEFLDQDIAVVGISDDPVEAQRAFATKFEFPFELLSDTDRSVTGAYESLREDGSGVARNTYVIDPDGQIALAYEHVTPQGHAAELLSDIEAAST